MAYLDNSYYKPIYLFLNLLTLKISIYIPSQKMKITF